MTLTITKESLERAKRVFDTTYQRINDLPGALTVAFSAAIDALVVEPEPVCLACVFHSSNFEHTCKPQPGEWLDDWM